MLAEPQKFHTWKLYPKREIVDGTKYVSVGKVRSTVSTHLMMNWTLNPVIAGGMVGCTPLRAMLGHGAHWLLGIKFQSVGFGLPAANELLGRVLRYLTPIRPVSEPNMFHTPQRLFQLKRKVSL